MVSPRYIDHHIDLLQKTRSQSYGLEKKIPKILSSVDLLNQGKKIYSQVILFYAPGMKNVAEETERLSDGKVRLGSILWNKFPDGTPQIYIEHSEEIKNSSVAFLASCDTVDNIFEQLAVLYELPNYLAKKLTVVLPFFTTGTMERVEKYGQIATAHTLAKLFSIIPYACEGPTQLCIFDIHALQVIIKYNIGTILFL